MNKIFWEESQRFFTLLCPLGGCNLKNLLRANWVNKLPMRYIFLHKLSTILILLAPSRLLAQGTWTTASSIGFTPRAALTSAVVDGKIYAIGGYDASGVLNTLEMYDPISDKWETPNTTGTFTARRGLCSAVIDGKIYVIGGFDGKNALNILEVFDPSHNTWTTPNTTGTFTPREKLCCSVVNNKIYVIDGVGGAADTMHFDLVEVFDPATNIWSTPSTSGTFAKRRGLASSALNGKIYVMGGFNGTSYLNTFEVFNPSDSSWSSPSTSGTFTARGALTSSTLYGKIYTMGGINYTNGGYHNVNIVEVFDTAQNSWMTPVTSGTFTARELLTSSVVGNKIYVMGGNGGGFLNTNEVFTAAPDDVKFNSADEISLYPNPIDGIIHISSPENIQLVEVINILGEKVMGLQNPNTLSGIDLSKLFSGTYYIRITLESQVISKLVIRK